MSPKPNTTNLENSTTNPPTTSTNVRSSSSCSSSSYQHTPPPTTMLPPPLLPPHSQHSPNQHANAQAAAFAAYHATMQQFAAFQNNQKLEQYPQLGHHPNSVTQLPPNPHLIQIPGYHQQHHQPGMPSLLLAPLANQVPVSFPSGSFPPLAQQSTQKFQSSNQKQNFKNMTTGLQERSKTPPIGPYPSALSSFINSDEDNSSEQGTSSHKSGQQLPSNQRVHRRSIPTITNFPNKYSSRHHNSNSISSTTASSTTSASSLTLKNTNSGSTSTLVSSINGALNSNNRYLEKKLK